MSKTVKIVKNGISNTVSNDKVSTALQKDGNYRSFQPHTEDEHVVDKIVGFPAANCRILYRVRWYGDCP